MAIVSANCAVTKAAHISGSMVVEITVDEGGNIMSVRTLSGHPLLRDTAVDAARGWKFTPTTLAGVPAKVVGTIIYKPSLIQGTTSYCRNP